MSLIEEENTPSSRPGRFDAAIAAAKRSLLSIAVFGRLIKFVLLSGILTTGYWLIFASDRYVSEANILIQRTDMVSGQTFDFSALIAGVTSANRPDQLLLREYLLSVDMLRKLDEALSLRVHYSDWNKDPLSRMWSKDASMEWFHRHYLSRVHIEYDDYAGVLRVKAQAYDPKTAQAITRLLVEEGERFMNQIAREIAEAQVTFLSGQVALAHERLALARRNILSFQNSKGMVSPQVAAENIVAIISKLEAQRAEIQTQLASLPAKLVPDHPNILMLKKSLVAVEAQITQENGKLASTSGKALNLTVDEFHRLEMEVNFTQDVYKTALIALERGRVEATRTLKKVSVLQVPTFPEYPLEPRRIYNAVVTLLFTVFIVGIIKLTEQIVRDHVD